MTKVAAGTLFAAAAASATFFASAAFFASAKDAALSAFLTVWAAALEA